MTSAIITLTQGDFLYIDEWIQYHHNIGIELFCIGYNGDSKDFNKLPKYDYVKYFDFSTNDSEIFNEFNSTISKRGWPSMWCGCVYIMNNYIKFFCKEYIKYVAIIDVDEFISPQEEFTNITEYLDNIYDQSLPTEFISMQVYNGNGNIYYEDKPVLERFIKSINPFKDITPPSLVLNGFPSFPFIVPKPICCRFALSMPANFAARKT